MFYLFVSEKNLFQIIILGDFLCRVGLMGCRGELPGEVVPAPGSRSMSQGDFMCWVELTGCRGGLLGEVVPFPVFVFLCMVSSLN